MRKVFKEVTKSVVVVLVSIMMGPASAQVTNIPTTDTKVAQVSATPFSPDAYVSAPAINFVRTWQPQKPYTSVIDVTSNARTVEEVARISQYVDGLGRPIQNVSWQSSPGKKDLVTAATYDDYGREQFKFLPYADPTNDGLFKQTPFVNQSNFYSTVYPSQQPGLKNEQFYYSKTTFEESPLNRVIKTFAPGNSWVGSEGSGAEHMVGMQFLFNKSDDAVRIWNITNDALLCQPNENSINIPTTLATFNPFELFKNVTTDENNNKVIEYKDKDEKVILKKVQIGIVTDADPYTNWLCTYYIYDDYGLLRFVMPPKAVNAILNNNWVISDADVINELCFRYEYDSKDRMIAKKVPGAGWVYMIYDKRDRLVFTQDANMRNIDHWLYSLYDAVNRVVETGMITSTMNSCDLQQYVDEHTGNSTISTNTTTGDFVGNQGSGLLQNVVISTRVPGVTLYQATESIEFNPEFETEDNADFAAEIVTDQPGTSSDFISQTFVLDNSIPTGLEKNALTLSFYDDYSQTSKAYDNSNNSKLDIGANLYGELLPSQASSFTKGLSTVSRVRVLENPTDLSEGKWLEAAVFYDEKAKAIQTKADNYKGGIDVATSRFDFIGKVVCSYTIHNNPAAGITNLRVKTNFDYDHANRLKKITKEINDDETTTRILVRKEYDDLGKLLTKQLGQKTAADQTALEIQDYTYNIRGWLKGINWDYTENNNGTKAESDKWFAIDLSYDWGYTNKHFNGNITGSRWQSRGDQEERSYGFGYDAANRLLYGDFNQRFGTTWTKTDPSNSNFTIDFTVKMGDGITGSSAYDLNGNIRAMQQNGLVLNSSPLIDNLSYTYNTNSNKLVAVNDAVLTDNKLGDFTDKNISADDYDYDVNGNLLEDKNKSITIQGTSPGIIYNHLNLPYRINAFKTGTDLKGTVTYVYDAAGNKLEKRVHELQAGTNPEKNTTTTYIGGYVYENNVLQFFGQEEGRIRKKEAEFVYDYMIKDYLGNVRAVLTDEIKIDHYPTATLEGTGSESPVSKESIYYDINTAFVVDKNLEYPNDNGTNNLKTFGDKTATSTKMYSLKGDVNPTGLGIVLKVMAGDKMDILAKSYSKVTGNMPTETPFNANDLISAFLGTMNVSSVAIQHAPTATLLNGNPNTTGPISAFFDNQDMNSTSNVKAGLCYIIFDEHFNYVSGSFDPVSSDLQNPLKSHFLQNIEIPKNGYIYIYCSNRSNINVYFDNLEVIHTRSPLLEENHYYPFGLSMAGISSKAVGTTANKLKYNSKEEQRQEFSDGSGLELLDYGARMQDPQIGRWFVVDPLAEKYFGETPYNYCLNNPISFIDNKGMDVYLTNSEGKVILAKKENKTDILYAIDKSGNIKDIDKDKKISEKDGIQVQTKGMLDGLTKQRLNQSSTYKGPMFSIVAENTPTMEDDLLNIFHFVSNNTDVEFSLTYFKNKRKDYITLATFHDNQKSPGPEALGLKDTDIYKRYHDHPLPYSSERASMGENAEGYPVGGDFLRQYGQVTYPYYVFFPNSTNLYQIKNTSIELIQKINNDYKKLKK